MKSFSQILTVTAALGALLTSVSVAADTCTSPVSTLKQAISAKPATLLEVVSKQVSTNPGCACELVKAAIEASDADAKTVASIVETAATAAPDQMRLVAQCAVAVSPDSLTDVQSVLAKLDPSSGESAPSSKDSKDAKPAPQVADAWNPLDFPGEGPVGPRQGDSGGYPVIPPSPIIGFPPVAAPPVGTRTNFVLPPI